MKSFVCKINTIFTFRFSYRETHSDWTDRNHQWHSVSQGKATTEIYYWLQFCYRASYSSNYHRTNLCYLRQTTYRRFRQRFKQRLVSTLILGINIYCKISIISLKIKRQRIVILFYDIPLHKFRGNRINK